MDAETEGFADTTKIDESRYLVKQIMYEFKFATSSHFNFYCKQHLGAAPMQIRNSNKDDNMSTLP